MGIEYLLRVKSSEVLPTYSDKCILPQKILSKILDIHDESSLPHPLIFKLKGHENDIQIYVGVREFSSPDDNLLIVPEYISRKLKGTTEVSIELQENVPKASSLSLKPLHFYSDINNWKYFLEDKLTAFYTTLTKGENLILESNNLRYELQIENLNETVACIIDTDISLDIVPLNVHNGTQQLEFKSFTSKDNDIIIVENQVEVSNLKSLTDPSFCPTRYKIDLTKFQDEIYIILNTNDYDKESIFNVDLLVGFDKLLNMENFIWSTISEDLQLQKQLRINDEKLKKYISIDLKSDRIKNKLIRYNLDEEGSDDEKWLFIIPFAWHHEASINLTLATNIDDLIENVDCSNSAIRIKQNFCSNCNKSIPPNQLAIHEAFCVRNNIKCSCGQLFHKVISDDHWHCNKCSEVGNSEWLREKHEKLYHQQYTCQKCDSPVKYDNYVDLISKHMGTNCPNKLHECKFCHLTVPQGEATYQDNFENLTNHESLCGNKTIECYKCSKIFRRKDLIKHMKIHDLEKAQLAEHAKATFSKCRNVNCLNLLNGNSNLLFLCDLCYGPFYNTQIDPNNSRLQSRLERKYMMQLTKGCGNTWCHNQYCKTGNPALSQNPKPIKELITLINTDLLAQISSPVLPINKDRITSAPNTLYFCVNESISKKILILQAILSENKYDEEIVYKALNICSSEETARAWLSENAILVH